MDDFEKLVITRKYVSALENDIKKILVENGKLKSEIDHLNYQNYLLKRMSKPEVKEVRRDEHIKLLQRQLSIAGKKIAELTKDKNSLINKFYTKKD